MTTMIKLFDSVEDLLKHVEATISNYNRVLAVLLRVLDEYRVSAENERRLQRVIESVVGKKALQQGLVIDLDSDSHLLVNPSAISMVDILSRECIERINAKLSKLQRIRSKLLQLVNAGISFPVVAVIVDDIPVAVVASITPPLNLISSEASKS